MCFIKQIYINKSSWLSTKFISNRFSGSCFIAIIWFFPCIWFDVCKNISRSSHFHIAQWRRHLQRPHFTRFEIDFVGVCTLAHWRARGDFVGNKWPHGTTSQQFNTGNQLRGSECGVSATGKYIFFKIKIIITCNFLHKIGFYLHEKTKTLLIRLNLNLNQVSIYIHNVCMNLSVCLCMRKNNHFN